MCIICDDYIYFILSPDNFVKIGRAANPKARLKSLQTGSSSPLELIKVIPNHSGHLETELHKKFASLRQRGEWFRYTRAIRNYLGILSPQDALLKQELQQFAKEEDINFDDADIEELHDLYQLKITMQSFRDGEK